LGQISITLPTIPNPRIFDMPFLFSNIICMLSMAIFVAGGRLTEKECISIDTEIWVQPAGPRLWNSNFSIPYPSSYLGIIAMEIHGMMVRAVIYSVVEVMHCAPPNHSDALSISAF